MTCNTLYWDQELLTCTDKQTGNCLIGETVTAINTGNSSIMACMWSVYNDDQTRFWIQGHENSVQSCAPGLIFDATIGVCDCVVNGTLLANECDSDLILDIPYESHFDDVSCHHAKATEYGYGATIVNDTIRGNVACFTGTSHFEVPFMQNWFANNNVDKFTVEFVVKNQQSSFEVEGMLNNADCTTNSTFEFTAQGDGVFVEGSTDGSGTVRTTVTTIPADTWVTLKLTYDGTNFIFYVNGVESKRIHAHGYLKNNNVPLIIGSLCNEHYFVGCIDDIKIWSRVV